jgi:acyl transferase domain-containing protein
MQYKYLSWYSATGCIPTILSNGITHCFDLKESSVVMDTACSSSIQAAHFAYLALDVHDCDVVVVPDSNSIQSAEQQLISVEADPCLPNQSAITLTSQPMVMAMAEQMV